MLEPLAVDPNRSVGPAANSIASANLVFPAPAGPTSAITRVPLDGCPAMRLYLRAVRGARVAQRGARAPLMETSTVRLFSSVGKRSRYGPSVSSWNAGGWATVVPLMVDPKGHQARSPAEMPERAWKDI